MAVETTRDVQVATLRGLLTRLAGEPTPLFDEFAALFRAERLEKGEFLVHAGEQPDSVACVTSGVLRLFYVRRDGKEFNKGFVVAPDFVSAFEALVTRTPSRLAIQALGPLQLLVAAYTGVEHFFERDNYWQRAGRLMAERLYVKKARREASLLMDSAAERYAAFMAEYPDLASQVADYHIASYLGITPEALSRLRRTRVKSAVRPASGTE